MAYGDRKSSRSSGGGGGGGRAYSGFYDPDPGYRQDSKLMFDLVMGSGDPCDYLKRISLLELARIYHATNKITRHGKKDWQRIQAELTEACIQDISKRVEEALAEEQADRHRRNEDRERSNREWQAEQAVIAEARKQAEYERKEGIVQSAQLMLGSLQSETAEVFQRRERYELDQGDYLEDPVSSRLRSGGWIEDTTRRGGFKLQLTMSLDVSNSNWYNGVAPHSIKAFQELVLAARALKEEQPDSVSYSAWLFSKNRDGKGVEQLLDYTKEWSYDGQVQKPIEDPLKETAKLFGHENREPSWAGEDSYIYPLLQAIANWEADEVEAGAVKLDIILSDGVFERKVDIATADDIQARRGQVHTVVLNFMPEEQWFEGRLPFQVVQYSVTSDNVQGILRLVLAQFLEAYI